MRSVFSVATGITTATGSKSAAPVVGFEVFHEDLMEIARKIKCDVISINTADTLFSEQTREEIIAPPLVKKIENGEMSLSQCLTKSEKKRNVLISNLRPNGWKMLKEDLQTKKLEASLFAFICIEFLHCYPCSNTLLIQFSDTILNKGTNIRSKMVPIFDAVRTKVTRFFPETNETKVSFSYKRVIAHFIEWKDMTHGKIPVGIQLSKSIENDTVREQLIIDLECKTSPKEEYKFELDAFINKFDKIAFEVSEDISFGTGSYLKDSNFSSRKLIKIEVKGDISDEMFKQAKIIFSTGNPLIARSRAWLSNNLVKLDFSCIELFADFMAYNGNLFLDALLTKKGPRGSSLVILNNVTAQEVNKTITEFNMIHSEGRRRIMGIAVMDAKSGNFARTSNAIDGFRMTNVPEHTSNLMIQKVIYKALTEEGCTQMPESFKKDFHESRGYFTGTISVKTNNADIIDTLVNKVKKIIIVEKFNKANNTIFFSNKNHEFKSGDFPQSSESKIHTYFLRYICHHCSPLVLCFCDCCKSRNPEKYSRFYIFSKKK